MTGELELRRIIVRELIPALRRWGWDVSVRVVTEWRQETGVATQYALRAVLGRSLVEHVVVARPDQDALPMLRAAFARAEHEILAERARG